MLLFKRVVFTLTLFPNTLYKNCVKFKFALPPQTKRRVGGVVYGEELVNKRCHICKIITREKKMDTERKIHKGCIVTTSTQLCSTQSLETGHWRCGGGGGGEATKRFVGGGGGGGGRWQVK